MDLASALLLYAALLGWGADHWLGRSNTLRRSPRMGLAVSHAVSMGVIAAFTCATAVLAHDVWEHGLAWLLDADKALLHAAYAKPEEVPRYWNASALLLPFGFAGFVVSSLRRRARRRDVALAHRFVVSEQLSLQTADGKVKLLSVCDHPRPAIYCLPSGSGLDRIQVTTGAMRLLDERELRAAVEHEHGHIVRRHHVITLYADTVSALFRWAGMLRHYPAAVRELVELEADDFAAERHGSGVVASALLQMAAPPAGNPPATALSVTGGDSSARIRRLLWPGQQLTRSTISLLALVALTTPTLPATATLAPALAIATGIADRPAEESTFVHHG